MTKKIGIIGGMGPAASCDFYNKLINLTPANCDQEHIHVVLDSNTNITDRTAFILDNSIAPSPAEEIIKSAKFLEITACDAIVMTCVTAHYFADIVKDNVNIPLIDITEVSTNALKNQGIKKAALLVTDGSLQGKVFEPAFVKYNLDFVYPDAQEQKLLMNVIYDYIKAGDYKGVSNQKEQIMQMVNNLKQQGAEAFVLGCTELPIAFNLLEIKDVNLLDTTYELAKAVVEFAKQEET